MNIFGIILFFVCVLGVLVFICFFWYTFGIHDFGQNDWEEKELKRGNAGNTVENDKQKEQKKRSDESFKVDKHIFRDYRRCKFGEYCLPILISIILRIKPLKKSIRK